jgi:A/G-specific adenine glycosylase
MSRRKVVMVQWPLALIHKNGKILLRRRPQSGLLDGLWEIPGGERKGRETTKATLSRHLKGLDQQVRPIYEVAGVPHRITHRKIRAPIIVFASAEKLHLPDPSWRWVPISSLSLYPLSSLSLKAVRLFTQQ